MLARGKPRIVLCLGQGIRLSIRAWDERFQQSARKQLTFEERGAYNGTGSYCVSDMSKTNVQHRKQIRRGSGHYGLKLCFITSIKLLSNTYYDIRDLLVVPYLHDLRGCARQAFRTVQVTVFLLVSASAREKDSMCEHVWGNGQVRSPVHSLSP